MDNVGPEQRSRQMALVRAGGLRSIQTDDSVADSPLQTVLEAVLAVAVENGGIDDAAAANAVTSPSLQFTSESKTKYDMPLSLIVGQDTIKTALILLAVNPSIGGIVIAGGKGKASDKIAALKANGVAVSPSPATIGETLAKHAAGVLGE